MAWNWAKTCLCNHIFTYSCQQVLKSCSNSILLLVCLIWPVDNYVTRMSLQIVLWSIHSFSCKLDQSLQDQKQTWRKRKIKSGPFLLRYFSLLFLHLVYMKREGEVLCICKQLTGPTYSQLIAMKFRNAATHEVSTYFMGNMLYFLSASKRKQILFSCRNLDGLEKQWRDEQKSQQILWSGCWFYLPLNSVQELNNWTMWL